jgi:hypothetical protein
MYFERFDIFPKLYFSKSNMSVDVLGPFTIFFKRTLELHFSKILTNGITLPLAMPNKDICRDM